MRNIIVLVWQSSDAFLDFPEFKATKGLGIDSQEKFGVLWELISSLRLGNDWDIMTTSSADNGLSWSRIAPLHATAATDQFDDITPSIAVNRNGVFVVAWLSNSNIGGLCG